ncbi:MAG: hypothetical protein ACYDD1_04460 [Caulobacteraceae bacterium]
MTTATFAKPFEYPPVGTRPPPRSKTVYKAGQTCDLADAVYEAATAAGVLEASTPPAAPGAPAA